MDGNQFNYWSNNGSGFIHFRRAIVLNLLKSDGRRRDILFSSAQLLDPLNKYLSTSDDKLNLAKVGVNLFNAFDKPQKSDDCFSCQTVFDGLEEYEDYNDCYIHINKKDGKIACSESADSSNFRSVDDDEAKQLLLNLSLDKVLHEKVQTFLRDRKRKGGGKKKRPKSQNSARRYLFGTHKGRRWRMRSTPTLRLDTLEMSIRMLFPMKTCWSG